MLVKMRRDAPAAEITTVEQRLHDLGFKTGRLEGTEITLIGVYGDITTLPKGEIEELPGVEQLIPISRAYKRAAQKGGPEPPLTANLSSYLVPAATELPAFETAHTETPTSLNPLGAKGIGESATIGSTPAVQNAVVDALTHLGVRHVDLTLSPERVWRAIHEIPAS